MVKMTDFGIILFQFHCQLISSTKFPSGRHHVGDKVPDPVADAAIVVVTAADIVGVTMIVVNMG